MCRLAPILVLVASGMLVAHSAYAELTEGGEWPNYGGDYENTQYSLLDQIDGDNFADLTIA